MKQILKTIIAQTPYRIVRDKGANRFQAIDISLRSIKDRGFCPHVVIDGGAHLGLFSLETKKIFPRAKYHLIEPQPACAGFLKELCSTEGFVLHECALAECVGKIGFSRTSEPNTGAQIKLDSTVETDVVLASTLDALFEGRVSPNDNALLKMDLQGYELQALRGASKLLPSVEVILTEVSFFGQGYEPRIVDLISFLDARGFELYDIASLSGRTRDNRLRQGDFLFVRKDSPLLEDTKWE